MPSLSAFFRKRRSLASGPSNDNHGDNHPDATGLTHTDATSSPAASIPRGEVDLGTLEQLTDTTDNSSDAQAAADSPTIATGPARRRHSTQQHPSLPPRAGTGRLNRYVSVHDPFRRFRSRSTSNFRLSGVVGGGGSGDGDGGSWPVRRSASESPEVGVERAHAQEAQPRPPLQQRSTDNEWSLKEEEASGRSGAARDASLAALERPAASREQAGVVVQQQQSQPTSNSAGRDKASTPPTSSGGTTNKLQKLKRLPSLSLKRGFSRKAKEDAPKVVVTPATMILNASPPNSAQGSKSHSHHTRQSSQSPSNHNKPLPPTPPEDHNRVNIADTTVGATGPKSLLRLNRIMVTLSTLDIEKLFSGAPQFFDRSEGHFTGAPHPSVAFPWDEGLAIRDLTDHTQIEDEAWSCITAWPHITRDVRRGPSESATRKVAERRRAHFYPRCRERPNMLSMQGLEKGTMGFQAALELGVSDALQEEQWGFGSLGAKDGVIINARKHLIASKDGLRRLDETTVLDHLMKNTVNYQQKHKRDRSSCYELHKELFSQILHPPKYTDPYSLSGQVLHLVKVLATPNVWVDFSRVEWRIRLGQILWGTADDDGDSVSDGASITDAEDTKGLHEERYWLLLQILLACELLIRLDTITEGDEIPENVKPEEIHKFERDANLAVKWSLHLARAWLENIDITKAVPSATGENENPRGWLANLTNKMTLTNERPHSRHHDKHHDHKPPPIYVMKGKYWDRQVRGLTHFARRLKWPEIDAQSTLISDNCRAVTEGTPLNTPFETPFTSFSVKSRDSSYFAMKKNASQARKRRQKVGAALHPAGWLSKSYVSGLMLPGEGIYHFMMSTLLENDIGAMRKLGPMANLCGGFIYSGKSFWSTACVVGRVLAAGKGAVECMGWISSDVLPDGLGDGWLNIDSEDIPEDVKKTGKQARIWGKLAVERESSVLGGSDKNSILPADFIIPFENNYSTPPPTISIELKCLNLAEPLLDSVQTTPTIDTATPLSYDSVIPEMKTFTPSITFNVTTWEDDEDQEHTFHVVKDVYFVTAHPCVPSHHVRILKSPHSPTIQQIDLNEHPVPGNNRSSGHAKITCHPLHKFYTYTPIHLSELIYKAHWTLDQLLSDPAISNSPSITPSSAGARPPRVLVIDAITNFIAQPEGHEIPLSPVTSRASGRSDSSRKSSQSGNTDGGSPTPLKRRGTEFDQKNGGEAEGQMHNETRRRQFGSDMEMLVRAICAERGWNALISRRRRGCLACAIREAGALGWRVIIRVD